MLMFSGIISSNFPLLLPLLEFKHENDGNGFILTITTKLVRLQSQRHKRTGIVIVFDSKTARIGMMGKETCIPPVANLTWSLKKLMFQVNS